MSRGRSQSRDYYYKLSEARQIQFLKLVKRMGDGGKIFDKRKFRNEGDQIFAFKPAPDRFLCFFSSPKKIVIMNAFHKKGDKLPKEEKSRALRHNKSYERQIAK